MFSLDLFCSKGNLMTHQTIHLLQFRNFELSNNKFRVPTFPLWQNSMIFPWYSQSFSQISRYNFPLFHVAYIPIHSLIPLVGGDSDLKSTELWFSYFERNLPRCQIHWLRSKKNGIFQKHYSAPPKKLKSVLTITEIFIFPGFFSFFPYFSKF